MPRPIALPTVQQYCDAILAECGPYVVPTPKGPAYFANPDDADRQRRWLAESWHRDDLRRAARIEREMQEHAA